MLYNPVLIYSGLVLVRAFDYIMSTHFGQDIVSKSGINYCDLRNIIAYSSNVAALLDLEQDSDISAQRPQLLA